jgi:hypothetical protein
MVVVLLNLAYLQVPMMGSAVSLLPFKEAGQHFCLSMVSGITTLALQVQPLLKNSYLQTEQLSLPCIQSAAIEQCLRLYSVSVPESMHRAVCVCMHAHSTLLITHVSAPCCAKLLLLQQSSN